MNNKLLILALPFLFGCLHKSEDFLKAIENGSYDTASTLVSEYCNGVKDVLGKQGRIEARREIRQRGENGPLGPVVVPDGFDVITANSNGPVVRIWCEGEVVTEDIWLDLIK